MTKITSLPAQTGASVDPANDQFEIVDVSASTNMKITLDEILIALTEGIQDLVGALLVEGANVTLTYDDASGTLEVAATPPGPGDISGFNEAVDDRVAALITAGSGIGKSYDDSAGTLTLTATTPTGGMIYKGVLDCSANPNYPAATQGDSYLVSVAGKVGGASGESVDVGDLIIASATNAGGTEASVGASWFVLEHNGAFGVTFATAAEVRAGSVTDKAIAPDKLAAALAVQTLTDGATVSWDMSSAINAKVTLGGNRTLSVSNPTLGATYSLGVAQDATGSRTMTWPSSFDWGTTGAPALTNTASKRDRITLFCTDASTPKFDAFLSGRGFS